MMRRLGWSILFVVLVLFFVEVAEADSANDVLSSSEVSSCETQSECPNAARQVPIIGRFTLLTVGGLSGVNSSTGFVSGEDPAFTSNEFLSGLLLANTPALPRGDSLDLAPGHPGASGTCRSASATAFICFNPESSSLISDAGKSTWELDFNSIPFASPVIDIGAKYAADHNGKGKGLGISDRPPAPAPPLLASEPSSLALFGGGLLLLCFIFRRAMT